MKGRRAASKRSPNAPGRPTGNATGSYLAPKLLDMMRAGGGSGNNHRSIDSSRIMKTMICVWRGIIVGVVGCHPLLRLL
ncbi:unnamed protein product [Gongylonema pulchrum]|uniref:DUF4235 domain-containing protein n=1 Tax=Gongylonema pulchrum TaxID=637853 RepID=A0A183DB95_9BILA|nr:unnamed protein product [Gongylonema pulchrum]